MSDDRKRKDEKQPPERDPVPTGSAPSEPLEPTPEGAPTVGNAPERKPGAETDVAPPGSVPPTTNDAEPVPPTRNDPLTDPAVDPVRHVPGDPAAPPENPQTDPGARSPNTTWLIAGAILLIVILYFIFFRG